MVMERPNVSQMFTIALPMAFSAALAAALTAAPALDAVPYPAAGFAISLAAAVLVTRRSPAKSS